MFIPGWVMTCSLVLPGHLDIGRVREIDHVNVARLELQETDRVFRDDPEDQLIQKGALGLVPIVFVGLKGDSVVFDPLDQLERPRPDRIADKALRILHEGRRLMMSRSPSPCWR